MDYSTGAIDPAVSQAFGVGGVVFMVIMLVVALVSIAATWKIFTKAGKPGWAAIIPIYNFVIYMQIIKRPVWWLILFFVPFVNIAITIITSIDLAKVFGKSPLFGVIALWLIPVGYLILGFGSAKYVGNTASGAPAAPPVQPPSPPVPTPEPPAPPTA